MAEAIRTGVPYQTILDPPPGQGPRHRLAELRGDPCGGGAQSGGRCFSGQPWRSCATRTKILRTRSSRNSAARIQLNAARTERDNSGLPRYERAVGFHTGDAATVGWMTKHGGWSITEAGLEALETYPTADELYAELNRRYREVDQRRKQAQQNLSDVQQFIAGHCG